MSATMAAAPGSAGRDPIAAPVDPGGHSPLRAPRLRDEPAATSVPQIKHDVDGWACELMALAARLGPRSRGGASCATLEQSLSVARLTESTVVACALDLQRLAVVV